jgi:hypothetical protein
MTYSVIAIAIAFYQAVVTTQAASLRMLTYSAFKIQATKVKYLAEIRTPFVYYKTNKGLMAAIKKLHSQGGTNKATWKGRFFKKKLEI